MSSRSVNLHDRLQKVKEELVTETVLLPLGLVLGILAATAAGMSTTFFKSLGVYIGERNERRRQIRNIRLIWERFRLTLTNLECSKSSSDQESTDTQVNLLRDLDICIRKTIISLNHNGKFLDGIHHFEIRAWISDLEMSLALFRESDELPDSEFYETEVFQELAELKWLKFKL